MLIAAKSLHHANFVIVFAENKFLTPDNTQLNSLYSGQSAAGARFIDDPIVQTKILTLPAVKIRIILERNRLRIEDESQKEPQDSQLIDEAVYIYQSLFSQFPLTGFGFNFDIYYRFNEMMRMKDLFTNFAEEKILEKNDLQDLGLQFTLDRGSKKQIQYFIKIVSPLEIAVHVNHHFPAKELPFLPPEIGKSSEKFDKSKSFPLHQLFEKCYNETDEVIEKLKF